MHLNGTFSKFNAHHFFFDSIIYHMQLYNFYKRYTKLVTYNFSPMIKNKPNEKKLRNKVVIDEFKKNMKQCSKSLPIFGMCTEMARYINILFTWR